MRRRAELEQLLGGGMRCCGCGDSSEEEGVARVSCIAHIIVSEEHGRGGEDDFPDLCARQTNSSYASRPER